MLQMPRIPTGSQWRRAGELNGISEVDKEKHGIEYYCTAVILYQGQQKKAQAT